MLTINENITLEDLKRIFSEVLDEKFNSLKINLIPEISQQEMIEITNEFGKIPNFQNEYEELKIEA
jgi:hypothetical protein